MFNVRWWLVPLLMGLHLVTAAQGWLRSDTPTLDLAPHIGVLHDPQGHKTPEQVFADEKFRQPDLVGSILNLGVQKDVYWLKIPLRVDPDAHQDWILDLPFAGISHAQAYLRNYPNESLTAASLLPRLQGYRYHAWPVTLTTPEPTLYLRVQASAALTLPLQLQSTVAFAGEEQRDLFIQALYFGALSVLLVFSLAFGASARDVKYVHLSGFLFFSGVAMLAGNGLLASGLWPSLGHADKVIESAGFAMAGAFALVLTRTFVHLASTHPGLDLGLRIAGFLYAFVALFTILAWLTDLETIWLNTFSLGLTAASAGLVLLVLWVSRSDAQEHSLFFVLAWVSICAGGLLAALRALGLVPTHLLMLYAFQIAIGGAALLFSVALVEQVRRQRQAHHDALVQTAAARQELIEHLKHSEQRLEKTVSERTHALSEALVAEKRMREQYVRFGAMISHEFRNPLGVIETQTALLERELAAGIDRATKRIGSVRAATQRLALLFEKWLQSDRLNNLQDRLELSPLQANTWIDDLVEKCHSYHVNHTVQLVSQPDIGTVQVDEQLLRIAVLNLIDNACKYSPANTVVRVEAFREDEQLCITVSDEGPGVADEFKARIFEEYFRIDPDSPVLGVGLGLPFVKKIAGLHGGRVHVQDNPGRQGACFVLKIPVDPGIRQPT